MYEAVGSAPDHGRAEERAKREENKRSLVEEGMLKRVSSIAKRKKEQARSQSLNGVISFALEQIHEERKETSQDADQGHDIT